MNTSIRNANFEKIVNDHIRATYAMVGIDVDKLTDFERPIDAIGG